MKALKKISAMLMVVMVMFCTVGCKKEKNSDNGNNNPDYSQQIVGKWVHEAEDLSETSIVMLNADKSMICLGTTDVGVYQYYGTYSVDNDNLTLTGVNGESVTLKFEFSGENLIINHEDGPKSYKRLIEDLDIIGSWEIADIQNFIIPVKDELLLPPGICDGQEIPESIPTASITGDFIEFALSQYLQNIKFTETHLNYDVTSGEETINLSKEYTLNSLNMSLKGEVGGLNVDVNLFVIQDKEKKETILVLNKETYSTMILGFAELLMESGIGSHVEPEVLAQFKQNFMETFETFATIIYLER